VHDVRPGGSEQPPQIEQQARIVQALAAERVERDAAPCQLGSERIRLGQRADLHMPAAPHLCRGENHDEALGAADRKIVDDVQDGRCGHHAGHPAARRNVTSKRSSIASSP
jgi:hypothetical protein